MNDWHLISDDVCIKIDVLLNLSIVIDENIICDSFTGEYFFLLRVGLGCDE